MPCIYILWWSNVDEIIYHISAWKLWWNFSFLWDFCTYILLLAYYIMWTQTCLCGILQEDIFFPKEGAFYATTMNMRTVQTLIRLQGGSSKYLCPRFKGKGRMVKKGLLYLQQVQGGDCIIPSLIYLAIFVFSLSLKDIQLNTISKCRFPLTHSFTH